MFGAPTVKRGAAYFQARRVTALEQVRPGAWRGEVRGTRDRPYTTMIQQRAGRGKGQPSVGGACSCPLRGGCKHVVATLLAIRAQQAQAPASRAGKPAATDSWQEAVMAHLDRTAKGPPTLVAPGSRQLLYVLRPLARLGRFFEMELILAWGRQAQGGPFAAVGAYSPASLRKLSDDERQALSAADQAALRSLALCEQEAQEAPEQPQEAVVTLRGKHAALAVQAAVTSGRAFFEAATGLPLRWGSPRAASLMWRVDASSSQTLDLDLPESFSVVTESPAVYIDEEDATLGRLDLQVPSLLLPLVAQAPSISPDQVDAFRAGLPAALAAALPPIRHVRRLRRRLPCTPILVVGDDDAGVGTQAGPLQARLCFAYGQAQTLPQPESAAVPLSFVDGSRVVEVARDEAAEARATAQLEALGVTFAEGAAAARGWCWQVAPTQDLQSLFAARLHVVQPLQALGWRVEGPVAQLAHVTAAEAPWEARIEGGDGSMWFDLSLGIEVGGQQHDLLPILLQALAKPELQLDEASLAARTAPQVYVPLDDGRAVALSTVRLRQILHVVQALHASRPKLGPAQALDLLSMAEDGGLALSGGSFALEVARRLRACRGIEAVAAVPGLQAQLRPYQLEGVAWLQFIRTYDLGGMLADDMGLGKTLQVLAHLELERQAGRLQQPALVVAPTSLLFNWQAEAQKFVPQLRVHTYHGNSRSMQDADLVLTSYGVVQRDVDALSTQTFAALVLDEAHVIKNPRSKQYAAIMRLKAQHRIALTGTPLQNTLADSWAQFTFLFPGILGTLSEFREEFLKPIEKLGDHAARSRLQQRLRPFLLRRIKEEVIRDLPKKSEIVRFVDLGQKQRDLYETVRTAVSVEVRDALASRGLGRSTVAVLDALLKLRQVCCDPRLLKLPGHRSASESAKLQVLIEMVEHLVQDGRRILVFSQFTAMLELIREALDARAVTYLLLTGKSRNRATLIEKFQSGAVPVFLISLKAGGVGLNLTAADTVIHYDPWWNPAVERQATDRAHRIGQTKPVFVYKMLARGSVEERIASMQADKAQLATAFTGNSRLKSLLDAGEIDAMLAPLAAPEPSP